MSILPLCNNIIFVPLQYVNLLRVTKKIKLDIFKFKFSPKISLDLKDHKKVYKIVGIRMLTWIIILVILLFSNFIKNINNMFIDFPIVQIIISVINIVMFFIVLLILIPHNIKILFRTLFLHRRSMKNKERKEV